MERVVRKKSFIFNCDWQEVLMDYPAEVRLEVYDAIIRYAQSGTLSELKPLAKMAFSFIKKEIDYNNERYEEMVSKRSEAGKKGMSARYGTAQPETQEDGLTNLTKANKANKSYHCYHELTNVTDNDNDNVNVNVNVNDNDERKRVEKENADGRRFRPPSLQEVKDYIALKGYPVSAEAFHAFYESKGWMVGKNRMKSWKAAITTWRTRENGRKDGTSGGKLGNTAPEDFEGKGFTSL